MGGWFRKSLVRNNDTLGDVVFANELVVRCSIQHVSGETLGANGLHLFQIEGIENGYISCPLCFCFPREFRQAVDPWLIGLQCSIDQEVVIHWNCCCPVPHELNDPGTRLPQIIQECWNCVLWQRNSRIQFGKETGLVGFFQFIVLDSGITDPKNGDTVDLHGIGMAIYRKEFCLNSLEFPITQNNICPILEIDWWKGNIYWRSIIKWNILKINNVSDGWTIDRQMSTIVVPTTNPLTDRIQILFLAVCDNNSVFRTTDCEDFLWYRHGVLLLSYSLII